MDRAEKLGLGAATAGHVVLFGLLSVGAYLLSGSICTLGALYLNKEMGKRMS